MTFDGASDTLDFDLIHHAYPTLESYLEHMDRYSSLGAQLLIEQGRISRNHVAFYWNVLVVPQLTFLWNYFFRLGFLDGREGLLLHLYHSAYVSWKVRQSLVRHPHPRHHPVFANAHTIAIIEASLLRLFRSLLRLFR